MVRERWKRIFQTWSAHQARHALLLSEPEISRMKRSSNSDIENLSPVAKKRKIAVREDVEALSEPHENFNADICKILAGVNPSKPRLTSLEMGKIEKNRGQKHKHLAYMAAVSSLAALPHRIESGDAAQKLHGIGEKIGLKITEILETGKLKKLDQLLADPQIIALNTLCRITGVGPQAAMYVSSSSHEARILICTLGNGLPKELQPLNNSKHKN